MAATNAENAPVQETMGPITEEESFKKPWYANQENEDIKPPLPAWTLEEFKTKNLVLWSGMGSPGTVRTRTLLGYYKIPYTIELGAYKSKHKDWGYPKMPVMCINDRPIDDSQIILKELHKFIEGRPWTEKEEKAMLYMTFAFQYPAGMAGNLKGAKPPKEFIPKQFLDCSPGCHSFAGCMINCCCPCFCTCTCCLCGTLPKKVTGMFGADAAKYNLPLFDLTLPPGVMEKKSGEYWAEILGDDPFFGGKELSSVDVNIYAFFGTQKHVCSNPVIDPIVEGGGAKLKAWMEAMDKEVKPTLTEIWDLTSKGWEYGTQCPPHPAMMKKINEAKAKGTSL